MAKHFKEIQIPNQKHFNSLPFPSVLVPNPSIFSLLLFIDSIKSEKSFLESLLHKTGAILFRNFPFAAASDFNAVVEAFGFDELPYIGGAAPRTNVVGRVFTANESPPDQKIPFHHEIAQVGDLRFVSYEKTIDGLVTMCQPKNLNVECNAKSVKFLKGICENLMANNKLTNWSIEGTEEM